MSPTRRLVLTLVTGILFASLTVMPRTLLVLGPLEAEHSGISASAPILGSHHLAVLLAFALFLAWGWLDLPVSHAFLLLMLPGMAWATWGTGPVVQAGVLQLIIGMLAWSVGASLGRSVLMSPRFTRSLVQMMTLILLFQMGLALLQTAGVTLPLWLAGTLSSAEERAFGSVSNAANLSKIAFYFLILFLPLSTTADRHVRRWAIVGVLAAVGVTGLTVSRANMASVAMLIVIWALIVPGRVKIGQRLAILTVIGAAGAYFAGEFLNRFATDDLDPRSDLYAEAIGLLPEYMATGMGPNAFVPVTGMPIPVHNTFVLITLELGTLLGLAFFLPFLGLVLRSLAQAAKGRRGNIFAWALVASLPGHALIMWTGWGVLSGFILPTFFVLLGMLSQLTRGPELGAPVRPAIGRRRGVHSAQTLEAIATLSPRPAQPSPGQRVPATPAARDSARGPLTAGRQPLSGPWPRPVDWSHGQGHARRLPQPAPARIPQWPDDVPHRGDHLEGQAAGGGAEAADLGCRR